MSYINYVGINTDNATGTAFGRLRVASPSYVFDTNFQYDLQPLVFEQIASGSGATVTHDATNRHALMTFSSTPTGGSAIMQTYEHFRYQAGRSQLIFATFNFLGGTENVLKFVGYSDGNNGICLQMNGTTPRIALLSDTDKGDEFVNQAQWNVDRLDGTGPSKINLDFTKTQILVIDLQWLGVGRVRVGFDVDGVVVVAHQFTHANYQTVAYMQTANLPIRAGMTCSNTASSTMRFICASVTSEGGTSELAGYTHVQTVSANAAQDARTHILSVRPRTTFNSITNRVKFVLENLDVVVTGNAPVYWELVLGQAITGTTTFNNVNNTYSAFEYNSAGTISGSPVVILGAGYVPSSSGTKGALNKAVSTRYPITLDAAGLVRANGTISLLATGIGNASNMRASVTWTEIR